jgi:hypothetical protein
MMSSSSTSADCSLADLFQQDLALSNWEVHFESTIRLLGNSGAICLIPERALPLDFSKFVNILFLVQHPEKGLIGFQITGFEPEGRVFSAQSLVASSEIIGFSSGLVHLLSFVASSRLQGMMDKMSKAFLPAQEIAGLSCVASQDGGLDYTVSSLSEKRYEFHVAPVLSSGPFHAGVEAATRHGPSDPTKTAPIKEIPRAVGEVLFAGMAMRPDMFAMNRAFTHFYAAVASNQWELPGEEESHVTDTRLHVAIPKAAAIMLLNACWVPLGHFRTEDDDQKVADAFSMTTPPLVDLRILGANEAIEAWSNCGDVLDRLFLLSLEFRSAWHKIAKDMYSILRCAHQFADMRHNGAVYDILDFLGVQLFQHLSNPAITVTQVRLALHRFQVCPDDRRFVALYDSAQRRFMTGPPVLTSKTGIKRVALGINTDAPEYVEDDVGQHHRRPCFNFFSTQGCSTEACRFSHGTLSVGNKAKVLSALATKGLVPDGNKM